MKEVYECFKIYCDDVLEDRTVLFTLRRTASLTAITPLAV